MCPIQTVSGSAGSSDVRSLAARVAFPCSGTIACSTPSTVWATTRTGAATATSTSRITNVPSRFISDLLPAYALSLQYRKLLLADEAGRAHLVEVDPCRDRPAVVVEPVPIDVVLAG